MPKTTKCWIQFLSMHDNYMLQWWIWYIPVMYTGLFVFDCLKQSKLFMHIHVPKSLKDKKEIFVIFAFSIILQLLTQNFDYLRLIETVQRPKNQTYRDNAKTKNQANNVEQALRFNKISTENNML